MLTKLEVALDSGTCNWVDYSVELRGLWYYVKPDEPSRQGKLPMSRFFPSYRSHSGGTFKWYGPRTLEGRQRALAAHPKPSYRSKYKTRTLIKVECWRSSNQRPVAAWLLL